MNVFLGILCLISLVNSFESNQNYSLSEFEHKSEILSRRKRFIVFPEGSSVQLVFCVTYPMIFEIGDIFLYGYTAALAWELPQDPYSPFDHHADPLHRRSDTKNVYFTDEKGKIIFKRPYKKKPIVNPAFAKRSIDSQTHIEEDFKKGTLTVDRKRMHSQRRARDFLKMEHEQSEFHRTSRVSLYEKIETLLKTKPIVNPAFAKRSIDSQTHIEEDFKKGTLTVDRKRMHSQRRARDFLKMEHEQSEFHRTSRVSLYEKIETLLKTYGVNGRECLLKTLCQVGQMKGQAQGDFVQEILRSVFTLPKGRIFDDEYHRDYDEAYTTTKSCDELYPECQEPIPRDQAPMFSS